MRRSLILALALASCSTLVEEGRAVPAWDGVTYMGARDERDVAMALTAWDGELRALTGAPAALQDLVIDERPGVPGDGYATPGRLHIDEDVPGWALLLHEATHEHLRVLDGDPDRDHAAGAGPWTALHDEVIRRAVVRVSGCVDG